MAKKDLTEELIQQRQASTSCLTGKRFYSEHDPDVVNLPRKEVVYQLNKSLIREALPDMVADFVARGGKIKVFDEAKDSYFAFQDVLKSRRMEWGQKMKAARQAKKARLKGKKS
jgi:hypothetical protein